MFSTNGHRVIQINFTEWFESKDYKCDDDIRNFEPIIVTIHEAEFYKPLEPGKPGYWLDTKCTYEFDGVALYNDRKDFADELACLFGAVYQNNAVRDWWNLLGHAVNAGLEWGRHNCLEWKR